MMSDAAYEHWLMATAGTRMAYDELHFLIDKAIEKAREVEQVAGREELASTVTVAIFTQAQLDVVRENIHRHGKAAGYIS